MTDFTYGSAAPATTVKAAGTAVQKPSTKSLLRRIYEGMVEARRLQAEMLVKRHLYGAF